MASKKKVAKGGKAKKSNTSVGFLYKRGSLIIKIFILITVILIGTVILNFDRFSTYMPTRYKFIFEKINDTLFGKVQVIEIYGNNIISKDEILTHIYKEEFSKDDLILINPAYKIIKTLSENQIVESVSVKRFLPNRMVVYVKEKKLILKFYNEGAKKFFAITENGKVLDYYNPNLKIPLVINQFEIDDTLKLYQTLLDFPIISSQTTDIISFFGYRFNLVLNRKVLINLPEGNVIEELKILNSLITENNILNKNIKQIDLRVKGKIFLDYFREKEEKIFKMEESVTVLNFSM